MFQIKCKPWKSWKDTAVTLSNTLDRVSEERAALKEELRTTKFQLAFLEAKIEDAQKGYPDFTFWKYQDDASRTISDDLDQPDMISHALHGMVGEIGELHSLYQKVYQGHKLDEDHAKKELGDLLWFIAEYATAMSWDLADVAKTNIVKLLKRYPEGFDSEHSLHREEGDI